MKGQKTQSIKKLGNKEQSDKIFKTLIKSGQVLRNEGTDNILIAVEELATTNNKALSNSYYLEALGYLGLNENNKAQELLKKSLEIYRNHLWAKNMQDF